MFKEIMNDIILRLSMLEHPFYQAWLEGSVSKETMGYYALQWLAMEENFTRFLSMGHSQCEVPEARRVFAINLLEEEGSDENSSHLSLWKQYVKAWGLTDDDIKKSLPNSNTQALIDSYYSLCSNYGWKGALSAMYAYESQIPEVAKTKADSLRSKYGMTNEESIKFFTLHAEVDKWHSQSWIDLSEKYFSDCDKQIVAKCTEDAGKSLLCFLDGIWEYHKNTTCQDTCIN